MKFSVLPLQCVQPRKLIRRRASPRLNFRGIACRHSSTFSRFRASDKPIRVILDNYAAHKKDKVRDWLARHSGWTFDFTPTSCSGLNAAEGFFAKLTRRRLKHGVTHSVADLQAAINFFIREYNAQNLRLLVWKASPHDIIADRNRGLQALGSIH